MYDIVAGYPLYVYYIGLISQFGLFPLLATFYSVSVFNMYFLTYLITDFANDATLVDNIMIAHHVICIVFTIIFSHTRGDIWLITIGEIGSGSYNIYTLANAYNNHVSTAYAFYIVVMTLSNIYCSIVVLRRDAMWYYKIPALILICGRQHFLYHVS